ncbi:MAG: GNAT family N-acetyltransferase [Clostridiales bacterium]|jgi:GNAT superfamily N-acetyltransferase|nr:GNAT family N-acetyltransferase [Clostridiales bacterium]
MINILRELSEKSLYNVIRLAKSDVDSVYGLMESNPQYFSFFSEQEPARSGILEDMERLPPAAKPGQKNYVGFFDGRKLVAVMDFIERYPEKNSVYIGLFMLDGAYKRRGTGTAVLNACLEVFGIAGYTKASLAYVSRNEECAGFWKKNGFIPTENIETEEYGAVTKCEKRL